MNTSRYMKFSIIFGCIVIGNFAATSMGQDSDNSILKEVARVIDDSKQFGRDLTEYPEGMANVESVISLGGVLARSSTTNIVAAASSVEDDAESMIALQIGLEQLEPRGYLNTLSGILESTTLNEDAKIAFLKSPDLYRHLLADNWKHQSVIDLINLAKEKISDRVFLNSLLEIESGVTKKKIDEYRDAVGGPATVVKIPESDELGGTAQESNQGSEEAALPENPESSTVDLETEAATKAETAESPSLPNWALVVIAVAVLGILTLLIRALFRGRAS